MNRSRVSSTIIVAIAGSALAFTSGALALQAGGSGGAQGGSSGSGQSGGSTGGNSNQGNPTGGAGSSGGQSQPGAPAQAPSPSTPDNNDNDRDSRDNDNRRDRDNRDQNDRGRNNPDGNNPRPGSLDPSNPDNRTPLDRTNTRLSDRNQGPFSFSSPQAQARFNQNTQRLLRMEQRMTENRRTLQRRLGEIRSLPADRQNGAILDLLQQTLDESNSLQDYLVATRTGITGEVELDPDFVEPLGSGQTGRDLNNANSRRDSSTGPDSPGTSPGAPNTTPGESPTAPRPGDPGTGTGTGSSTDPGHHPPR